jgi:hypothetical protein
MLEALWSVEFVSGAGAQGAGVVVLESGKALGGDAQYFYVGNYRMAQGVAEVDIKITHYHGQPMSIFGPSKSHDLRLKGTPARTTFTLTGSVVGNPQATINLRLTRRAELP